MWTSSRVFVVTIIDWSGAAPPVVGPVGLLVQANAGASRGIRADASTVGLSVTSSSVSPRLSGNFGPECISFESITAFNPSGVGDEYKADDQIIVVFNQPTNQGFTTLDGSTFLSRLQLDTLFSFSQSLGSNYTGQWDSTSQLTITVSDPTNAGPPGIEIFTIQSRTEGELRNTPAACTPSTVVSGVLQGDWGPCGLGITSITAADPQNLDMSYSVNDTIAVTFSKDTNQAGFVGTGLLSKAQVDALFSVSVSLGADYVGWWASRRHFWIRAVDVAGAGPPGVSFFSLSVRAEANLRNFPPQSGVCSPASPVLDGNWGTIIPSIVDFYADGAGGADGRYDAGDALVVVFDQLTNLARLPATGISKAQVDAVLSFSQSLGADYSAAWLDPRTLRITIVDPAGAAALQRGVLVVTCNAAAVAPIRNADTLSAGCFSSSAALGGDFGASGMTLTLTARGDQDPRLSAGDELDVAFSEDTDQAGLPARLSKAQVDGLLVLSQSLGANYSAAWLDNRTLRISVLDSAGGAATVGGLQASVNGSAGLRNSPPNSAAVTATSSPMTGELGPNRISILSITASDPSETTATFAVNDQITIIFSEDTNRADFGTGVMSRAEVDSVLALSDPLGADYQGQWLSRSQLQLTALDATGAGPPLIEVFTLSVRAAANLRNFPPTSAPAAISSPVLGGDFGPSPISIVSFVAGDATDLNNVYSVADTLTVTFSEPTNRANLPAVLDRGLTDSLFTFSQALGANYTARWLSDSEMVITIQDVAGAAPPALGVLTLAVRAAAKLRNLPPTARASSAGSGPLTGDFGILYPRITAVVGADPTSRNSIYSFLDTITLSFSIATNRAGRSNGDRLSRAQLLSQFLFSQSLGNAFSGEWVSASSLVITVEGVAGAAPPEIGALRVTCRTDTGALIQNEVGTSRACYETSAGMTGDFGPNSLSITALSAADPTGLGSRFRAGNTISVTFSEDTNRAGFEAAGAAGGTLDKAAVDLLIAPSVPMGSDYSAVWPTRRQLLITILNESLAGPPLPGVFTLATHAAGNLRNHPAASAPAEVSSPALAGNFGQSSIAITSWVAGRPPGTTACQGFVSGVNLTVTFSEQTNRGGLPDSDIPRTSIDRLFNFYYSFGSDYTGAWLDDYTLVLTITNAFGATPPQIGLVPAALKAEGNLVAVPPVTAAATAEAPAMTGDYGPTELAVVTMEALDPDNLDSVFGTGDVINLNFNTVTNRGGNPSTLVTEAELDVLLAFSHSLGRNFSGEWVSDSTLRITIDNAGPAPGDLRPYPPSVGTGGLQAEVLAGGNLRATPVLCAALAGAGPYLEGDFGPNALSVVSLEATSSSSDSVYGVADQIIITFSEDTNQGGIDGFTHLDASEIKSVFEFSQDPGDELDGIWLTPQRFYITVLGTFNSTPPEIGHLRVTVRAQADIRNAPPQSKPADGILSPLLAGDFGPSPISIVAFTAHDPANSASVYHAGVVLAVVLSELPTWNKEAVYHGQPVTYAELQTMLSFSASLGADYSGRWFVYADACPAQIYTTQPPLDGPPCLGIAVTVLDINGNGNPTIGSLTVRILAAGDIRNSPAQSAPSTASSGVVSGNWGITIPYITAFTAEGSGAASDAGYGDGDILFVIFSEATDRAGAASGSLNRNEVDALLLFDQALGADYRGSWSGQDSILQITIVDSTGASPPQIGLLTVRVRDDGGAELKNRARTSRPSDFHYTYDGSGLYGLQGNFGPLAISIDSMVGRGAVAGEDAVWGPGDVIAVTFSEAVNKGCFWGCSDTNLSHAYVSDLLAFSDALWAFTPVDLGPALSGRWLSFGAQDCLNCHNASAGPCKQDAQRDPATGLFPNLHNRTCTALAGGACPAGFSLCSSRRLEVENRASTASATPPTIGGLTARISAAGQLRDYPASGLAQSGVGTESPPLTGEFGAPCVQISRVEAADPVGVDGRYGPSNETITVTFDQDTNQADLSTEVSQAELALLLDFFCADGLRCPLFAAAFAGRWLSRRVLRIAVLDATNVFPHNASASPRLLPLPDHFFVAVRNGSNLRNYPPQCMPSTAVSPALTGSFGPSNIALQSLVVSDPDDRDDVYGSGDELALTFDRDTDYAGFDGRWSRTMVDTLLAASAPLGRDYFGVWRSRRRFVITITNATDLAPIDGWPCCNGSFQITVLASGGLRNFPPTSSPAETCGGPRSCDFVGVVPNSSWGACEAVGQDRSAACQPLHGDYGVPFPRVAALQARPARPAASVYGAGASIAVLFAEETNMGACTAADAASAGCSPDVGACYLVSGAESSWESGCAAAGGEWVPRIDADYDNCQLPQHSTLSACLAAGGQWTAGLAPHQTCSDDATLEVGACEAAGHGWRVHETVIARHTIDAAFRPSDPLGRNYTGRWTAFGSRSGQPQPCSVPCAREFVVTILDAAGAGPPEIDLLRVQVQRDGGVAIRSALVDTPGSADLSPRLSGDFGPPVIVIASLWAGESPTPGEVSGLYVDGVSLAVAFNDYTNRGNLTEGEVSRWEIERMLNLSRALGANYSGRWENCTLWPGKTLPGCQRLNITVHNVSGASPPTVTVDGLTATVLETGNLRNYPAACAPANASSAAMQGDFGPSGVRVSALRASDPLGAHSRVDAGDLITLHFNIPTDRAGAAAGHPIPKSTLQSLLNFSIEPASNYSGLWADRSTLVVTILTPSPPGAPLPYIGELTVQVLPAGALRSFPATSAPTATRSPPLEGGFGPPLLHISAIVGVDTPPLDPLYDAGDQIEIWFSEVTNQAGFDGGPMTKAEVDSVFNFSLRLGGNYSGEWVNATLFVVTVTDVVKNPERFWCRPRTGCSHTRCALCGTHSLEAPCRKQLADSSLPDFILNQGSPQCPDCPSPQIEGLVIANLNTTSCPNCSAPHFFWMSAGLCEFVDDGGYDPPTVGDLGVSVYAAAGLRELPSLLDVSTGVDASGRVPPARLSGGFGPSSVEIVGLVASDPASADSVLGPGDTITVLFSEPTNRGFLPASGVTTAQLDALLHFQAPLGAAYSGAWPDRQTLQITILNASAQGGPELGAFFVTTRATGGLRNHPAISLPTVVSGNANGTVFLTGDFGPSGIFIRRFLASSPQSRSDLYNVGAAFTVLFSEPTNRGGLPAAGVSKAQIDALLHFASDQFDPHPLGADYAGSWPDPATLVISILAIDRGAPEGPPPLSGDNRFRVGVRRAGGLRNAVGQSAATVIDSETAPRAGLAGSSGLNCDCCVGCGGCAVCDVTQCAVTASGGAVQESCGRCCSRTLVCCRVLAGNYGKIVTVYEVAPRRISTAPQALTVTGHGFDNFIPYNAVSIGGAPCAVTAVRVDAETLDGELVCLTPPGVGHDVKPLQVEVYDSFNEVTVTGFCCYRLVDGFLPDPLPSAASNGVLYHAPEVTAVAPSSLPYREGGLVTLRGRNFGPAALFDQRGEYRGPLGKTPRGEYGPPVAVVVMEGGAHAACVGTRQVSDDALECRTPEMSALNVSLVAVAAGQHSRAWARGTLLTVEYLPQFKLQCEAELSGRCFDCCEEQCQWQFEAEGLRPDPAEGFGFYCKRECMRFCGFTQR